MSTETPYFRLRVPETLKEQIRKSSEISGRSMTAEIIHRLEQSFDEPEYDADECFADIFKELDKMQREILVLQEHAGIYDPNERD